MKTLAFLILLLAGCAPENRIPKYQSSIMCSKGDTLVYSSGPVDSVVNSTAPGIYYIVKGNKHLTLNVDSGTVCHVRRTARQ